MIAAYFNRGTSMRTILAILLFAAITRPAEAQTFTVSGQFQLSTPGPYVAVGDVNGDGKPDVVTSGTITAGVVKVMVSLGDGAGGFAAGIVAATLDNSPWTAIALGDVNGDGKLDLAIVNVQAGVSVLLGNGAGQFGPRVDCAIPAFSLARDVKIADMTGDGRPDLVVGWEGEMAIFPGDGAGGFGARQDFSLFNHAWDVAIGDLNGDGLPDVCVTTLELTLAVLLADGTGGYLPRIEYAIPALSIPTVTTGDVNRDGKLDVVVARKDAVSVFLGDGTGALGTRTDYAATGDLRYPVLADMNGDGLADLALASTLSKEALVMTGNGTGAFAVPSRTVLPLSPRDLAVSDLNGDGRPELILPQSDGPPTCTILLNGTGGEFRVRSDIAVADQPGSVLMGDLNGDGRPDLAVTGPTNFSVLLARAAGGFQRADFSSALGPMAGAAEGDVDGDGDNDLAMTYSNSDRVGLRYNNGLGNFSGIANDYPAGSSPVAAALADLNDDGRLDLAAVNSVGNTVSVYLNDGTGSPFGAKTDYATGSGPADVRIGDVDGDGRLDLVVSNLSSNTARVFFGTGGGLFGSALDYATGTGPSGLAVGNLNGTAVAVANGAANSVSVLHGNLLLTREDYAVGPAPAAVAFGDVNGDGRPDLSVANGGGSTISLLLGNGANGFGAATSIPVASQPRSLAIGDLNGDGRLDLAVGAHGAFAVSVLLGLVPTKTTLTSSKSLLVAGSPMILNAVVSVPAPGLGTPADSVRFFDGNTLLGTAPVLGGQAGLVVLAPYRGERAITAVYKGDGKLFGSISNVVTPRVVATAAAAIASIKDVAGDQGGQARLVFRRSPYDYAGAATPITGYQVYRAQSAAAASAPPAFDAPADPTVVQISGWDYLQTVAAITDDVYQLVVPTLADSNSTGVHRARLFVRAATATPGVFYDSPADSGYSVDNLAPAMPAPLTAAYVAGATRLHWLPNGENDFASYRVYKGASAGFVPGPGNLMASPPDTGYADAGAPGSFYKVSAVDVNGNQSAFALVGPDATTDVVPDGLAAFALERVRPNPAPASRLVISFSLPVSAPARLEMFDVRGRRVAVQEVGGQAGRNSVRLSTVRLAPGIYMLRLTQGSDARTQRVTVVD